jgi:hypothetical protein
MRTLLLLPLLLSSATAAAEEGMWLPEQVPAVAPAWTERGLALDPATLADPEADPLGAVVRLGGCTASFVSEDGLLATNHHCVAGFLSYLSDEEHDLYTAGFGAESLADEPNVGPTARITVVETVTDVTDAVLKGADFRTLRPSKRDVDVRAEVRGWGRDRKADLARYERTEANKSALIAACEEEENRRCSVHAYAGGSQYRLVKAREIKDVRLVYAPPGAVGQFGGEVDNWMWPRHGADFAFVRAWVAPDGSSAPHSADNVPYRPPRHLTVEAAGAGPGEFVLAAGYPGSTGRHLLADALAALQAETLPEGLVWKREVAAILRRHAASDPGAAGRLASSIDSVENVRKKDEGTLAGLAHGDLVAARRADEEAFEAWLEATPDRSRRLGRALRELRAYEADERERDVQDRWIDRMVRGADLLSAALGAVRWAEERSKPDLERDAGYQDRDLERHLNRADRLDRTLHLPSDREILAAALRHYTEQPPELRAPSIDAWLAGIGGADAALEALYAAPALATAAARRALYERDLAALKGSTDPWVRFALAVEEHRRPRRDFGKADVGTALRLGGPLMVARAAYEAEQGRVLVEDANGTLRLTFGVVAGYEPEDGLLATPQTRLSGMVAKVGDAPFDPPAAFVERARAPGDRFVDPALGEVPADFLTTLDSTGGNSGSPVMDGRGRLVGLLFDGNWEAIASDLVFVEAVTRSICVDIRYVLWVLDGDAAGRRVLTELGVDAT